MSATHPTDRSSVFALVSGGGTGGHVFPAVALAEALVERGHDRASIRFVGAARGLEARVVPEAGYAIELLEVRGLRRSWSPRATIANASSAVAALRALLTARRLLHRLRPQVVVGVGGYASFPCVVAALGARVPVVVHEQNAIPGLVNRWAVRLGARGAASLPGTRLPGAITTGNPVRPGIAALGRDGRRAERADRIERSARDARAEGVEPRTVGVVGGSLGSARLNDAALGLYDRWRARTDVAVRHVAGERSLASCRDALDRARRRGDALRYRLSGFEPDMVDFYDEASLCVARAGAITVAELAAAGVPSVLVPWPGAAGDHQTHNARAMVGAGAAVLVEDGRCDAGTLARVAEDLLGDAARLHAMAAAARAVAVPDAAARLAALVEEVASARA